MTNKIPEFKATLTTFVGCIGFSEFLITLDSRRRIAYWVLACCHFARTGGLGVLIKVWFQSERSIAAVALELLERRMGLHVRPEIRAIGERFVTFGAQERPFSRMRPHMPLQEPRPTESFTAHITFVKKLVRQNMHGQCRHGDISFTAVFTALG